MAFGKKAQTSTEYVIILIVAFLILVIALGSFVDISFFSRNSQTILEQYYVQSEPLIISDIFANESGVSFYLASRFSENVTISQIWFDNISLALSQITISPQMPTFITSSELSETNSYLDDEEVVVSVDYILNKSNSNYRQFYFLTQPVTMQ